MTSVLSHIKEQTNINRQFTVYPYVTAGINNFFTVNNNILSRLDLDLSGVSHVIARDMGSQMVINSVDPDTISYWLNEEGDSFFENVQVIRPGIARKFQVLSVVSGFPENSLGSTGNEYAYSTPNPIFDVTGSGNDVNNLLIVGSDTSVNNVPPFGTFWVMNDPIVVRYTFSYASVQKAIKNRISETTLF